MNLWACASKGTVQQVKNAHIAQPTLSMGVTRYLNQFQLSLHKIIITITSLHILSTPHLTYSVENLGHVVSRPQYQKRILAGSEKEPICLVSVIS